MEMVLNKKESKNHWYINLLLKCLHFLHDSGGYPTYTDAFLYYLLEEIIIVHREWPPHTEATVEQLVTILRLNSLLQKNSQKHASFSHPYTHAPTHTLLLWCWWWKPPVYPGTKLREVSASRQRWAVLSHFSTVVGSAPPPYRMAFFSLFYCVIHIIPTLLFVVS